MGLHVQALGRGRPIVALPPFSLDHRVMASILEPVLSASADWRRLYVDLPGTGMSPAVEPRSDAVLDAVLDAVDYELDDQTFLVAGWSYGGYLAAAVARRVPERIGGMLMVCSGLRIRPEDRNLEGVLPSLAEPDWLADVPLNLHDHFAHAIGCQTAATARRVAAALALNAPTDETFLAALHGDGFALSDEDARISIDQPATFLNGRRDRVAGYVSTFEALDTYKQGTYVVAADAGHYLPLEQPTLFEAVTKSWLDACIVGRAAGYA